MDETFLQDYVERFFSTIRGLLQRFCLYPNALQFADRINHFVKTTLTKDEGFNFLGKESEFKTSDANNVKFSFDPNLPIKDFEPLELIGIEEMADLTIHKMSKVQDFPCRNTFLSHFKHMYTYFLESHPKDSLCEGNFIINAFTNELKIHFPMYHPQVLSFISKKFAYNRRSHMNLLIENERVAKNEANAKKRALKRKASEEIDEVQSGSGSGNKYQSLRAKRKTIEFASNN